MHTAVAATNPGLDLAGNALRWLAPGFVFLIVAVWGFGPIDKARVLYPVYGVNVGDLLFMVFLLAWLGALAFRGRVALAVPEPHLRLFLAFQLAFAGWALLSTLVNGIRYSGPVLDLFGALRLFFYAAVVVFVARWSARHGATGIATAFCAGTLLSGALNLYRQFLDPVSALVAGLPQLQDRNPSGAMFAAVILYAGLLVLEHRPIRALCFAGGALFLSAFTFSKGAWLMALVAATALFVLLGVRTLRRRGAYAVKAIVLVLVVAGLAGVYQGREVIGALVEAKIAAVRGDAQEGLVDVARLGQVLSSLDIAMEHPLLGVGESRWQAENAANREWLGSWYLENDNPHNGVMAILSMMGFPALFAFLAAGTVPFVTLYRFLPGGTVARYAVVLSMAGVFFVSANLMLHVYTQYYFWLFAGLSMGLYTRFRGTRRVLAAAAGDAS